MSHKLGFYIIAGEYEFFPNMTPYKVLQKLISGKVMQRYVTIPEGLTVLQIKQLLGTTYGLSGKFPNNCTEGTLMPDTYNYQYGATRKAIIRQMRQLSTNFLSQNIDNISEPLTNINDLLILASIVERETMLPREYKKISSVYINRLKRNMLLQADPTIIYALTDGKNDFKRRVLFKHLELDSPYNTYKYKGLPPTAICNPGRQAILATLNPAETGYLYFVSDGDGGHIFAETFKDHKNNVQRYRARRSH